MNQEENKSKRNNCPTKLLSDLPSEEDYFGGHERVAGAIAKLINGEDGGKSIAVIGSYGSGKSTVINLFRKKIESENNETKVFIFDAWQHEGDRLRRSFLEQLIDSLREFEWLEKRIADEEKNSFLQQVTKEKLTRWGALMLFIAIYSPLARSFLSNKESILEWSRENSPLFPIEYKPLIHALYLIAHAFPPLVAISFRHLGIFIFSLPLVYIFLGYVFCKTQDKPFDFSFLSNKHALRGPEPSSIEFQDTFDRLMDRVLIKDRKLILVVDNLDRVIEDSQIIELWGTMGTFFNSRNTSQRKWRKQLWVIAPFNDKSINPRIRRIPTENSKPNQPNDKIKSITDELIDKTFQATFHVPPPVLSDWRTYLIRCLKQAFEEHTPEDFNTIYFLYQRAYQEGEAEVHPRDIKIFVNKLCAVHKQWEDGIPIAIQAYYVLLRSQLLSNEGKFFETAYQDSAPRLIIGNNRYEELIAALYFNIEPERAIQAAMRKPVEKALLAGNFEELSKYKSFHGFSLVCLDIIQRASNSGEWITSPWKIGLVAWAIDKFGPTDGDAQFRQSWRFLEDLAGKVTWWVGLSKDVGRGISIILRRPIGQVQLELAKKILPALCTNQPNLEARAELKGLSLAECWAEGVIPTIHVLHESKNSDLIRELFSVPGNPNFYFEVMKYVSGIKNQELIRYFVPPDVNQINPTLKDRIQNRQALTGLPIIINTIVRVDNSNAWPQWQGVDSAIGSLFEKSAISADDRDSLIYVLVLLGLKNAQFFMQRLHSLSRNNAFNEWIKPEWGHNPKRIGLLALAVFFSQPNINTKMSQSLYSRIAEKPTEHPDIINEMVSFIREMDIQPELEKMGKSTLADYLRTELNQQSPQPSV